MHADWLTSLSGLCRNEDLPKAFWPPDTPPAAPPSPVAPLPVQLSRPRLLPWLLGGVAAVAAGALALVVRRRTFSPSVRYRL